MIIFDEYYWPLNDDYGNDLNRILNHQLQMIKSLTIIKNGE